MRFEGAVIKEQGVTFAIVVVKNFVIQSQLEFEKAIKSFSSCFPGIPVVCMAQDNRGTAIYRGRKDIVNFLSNIHVSRIPWKQYTI
jgi:hypothetical protein